MTYLSTDLYYLDVFCPHSFSSTVIMSCPRDYFAILVSYRTILIFNYWHENLNTDALQHPTVTNLHSPPPDTAGTGLFTTHENGWEIFWSAWPWARRVRSGQARVDPGPWQIKWKKRERKSNIQNVLVVLSTLKNIPNAQDTSNDVSWATLLVLVHRLFPQNLSYRVVANKKNKKTYQRLRTHRLTCPGPHCSSYVVCFLSTCRRHW